MYLINKIKYIGNRLIGYIYIKQIKLNFPIDILNKYVNYNWELQNGYSIQSYNNEIDLEKWAILLNEDGGFGSWNSERVRDVIVLPLIAPEAASLLFYNNELVGCATAIDCSRKHSKIGMGMWLILSKKHRGKKNLAMALTFRTMSYFAKIKYDKAIAYTDPSRLPALFLYLSNGVIPEYDSLCCYYKWWKVKRRLQPLLERTKK